MDVWAETTLNAYEYKIKEGELMISLLVVLALIFLAGVTDNKRLSIEAILVVPIVFAIGYGGLEALSGIFEKILTFFSLRR